MQTDVRRWVRGVAGVATLVVLSVGCGGEPAAVVGAPVTDETTAAGTT